MNYHSIYCIQGNIHPLFIISLYACIVSGRIFLFIILEHKTIMFGQIKDKAKKIACVKGVKITLYNSSTRNKLLPCY